MRPTLSKAAIVALLTLGLGACAREGDIFESGILTSYTACPAVAIPAPAGDITLFDPATSRDASAIDVVATMTDLRGNCDQTATENIVTSITFNVEAIRRDNHGARDVVLPYFTSVVQGNGNVVAKRLSRIALHFADGEYRAQASGVTGAQVLRSAATLPEDVRDQITRVRRAGDPQAALDPLADPAVRAAVDRAHFEVLVGFALDPDQLRYNATR
ncbi:hypothetical protein [Sphingosinicella ginsenosidimutans]|uniref:Uncharacterized protein n=1 Tax=Allosphingosinicella ginsenosidimutans TaxID=1176539 RepID=A0A5C6TPP8_9SPHN|nr:hypothetical protein [Sphingosinicella ginsenosidimutans]TXC62226.1 hypothetical protein FRZ32_00310 [Sphingosinicella ginsenosidimutans]